MMVRKEVGEKFKRKPKMYMYMKETKHDDVDENSD
jgi:hypothetical protein